MDRVESIFEFSEQKYTLREQGDPRGTTLKIEFCACFILGNKSYHLFFTASKKIIFIKYFTKLVVVVNTFKIVIAIQNELFQNITFVISGYMTINALT